MSNEQILCVKHDVYLTKKYDINEDDIYELYFKCIYDESKNIFNIIDNEGFENLFCELCRFFE